MNIKVFKTNANGKIEFTRCELEKMLNEIYDEGYAAGEKHMKESYWTWSAPYLSNTNNGPSISTTTTPEIKYDVKSSCDSITPKVTNVSGVTTLQKDNDTRTYTVNLGDLSKTIDEILNGKMSSDPFTTLAKELRNV